MGDLQGTVVVRFQLRLLETIIVDRPDELIVDLSAVTSLGPDGLVALMSGYAAAIDYGSLYRVVNAHHRVRRVIETAGLLDVLTDSEDLAALLYAVVLGESRT